MTRRFIFGIDPGKITGYAILNTKRREFETEGQAKQYQFCTIVESWLELYGKQTSVICESFIITMATAKNSQAPWSLELIGVARFLSQKYGADFKLRSPADAKRFSTNDKLKKIGWYVSGQQHLNDAKRHVLISAVEQGVVSPHDLI